MRDIVFLRHGVTAWNEAGRIQGRHDEPLSGAGRTELERLRLPGCWRDGVWYVSPLRRARQSAEALGARKPVLEPRLLEMDWGDWEGARLCELRAAHGDDMRRNEARGVDFRPPGGESPREVRERIRQWLGELPGRGATVLAMTHKGVIRAAISLATGWTMHDDFRPRPDWRAAHLFHLDGAGELSLAQLSVPLERVDG